MGVFGAVVPETAGRSGSAPLLVALLLRESPAPGSCSARPVPCLSSLLCFCTPTSAISIRPSSLAFWTFQFCRPLLAARELSHCMDVAADRAGELYVVNGGSAWFPFDGRIADFSWHPPSLTGRLVTGVSVASWRKPIDRALLSESPRRFWAHTGAMTIAFEDVRLSVSHCIGTENGHSQWRREISSFCAR